MTPIVAVVVVVVVVVVEVFLQPQKESSSTSLHHPLPRKGRQVNIQKRNKKGGPSNIGIVWHKPCVYMYIYANVRAY